MKNKRNTKSTAIIFCTLLWVCAVCVTAGAQVVAPSLSATQTPSAPVRIPWGDISPPWFQDSCPTQIAFRPGSKESLFVGSTFDGLLYSLNGGKDWYRNYHDFYIDEYTASWWVRDVVFCDADPQNGLAVTMAGTYWSDDGGMSWYPHGWPSPGMSHMAINAPDSLKAVVSGYTGDLWIYDWATRSFDMPIPVPGAASVLGISFDQSTPPMLYIGTTNSYVYRTDDLGQRFQSFGGGLPATVLTVVADPAVPGLVKAAAGPNLYTTNPAKTRAPLWFPIGNGLPGAEIMCLVHDPVDPDRMFAGFVDLGIYVSVDRGQNWEEFSFSWIVHKTIVDLAINPENPGFLLAAGHSGSSVNGGLYKIPIRRN